MCVCECVYVRCTFNPPHTEVQEVAAQQQQERQDAGQRHVVGGVRGRPRAPHRAHCTLKRGNYIYYILFHGKTENIELRHSICARGILFYFIYN